MPQSLSDIKALLAARDLRPKYRFGQNFLHDARKMDAILAAANIQPDQLILEVGPGTGALTSRLLAAGARVIAVEIDADLAPILHDCFDASGPRFQLIVADILASKHELNPIVLQALAQAGSGGHEPSPPGRGQGEGASSASFALPPFQLIANLPYNVASPLLVNLALDYPAMTSAIVMVQKEVADRLAAGPGSKDYGPMGILVQAACAVKRIATLPPGCFWPPPEVTSAVVLLSRRATPLAPDLRKLGEITHRLFSQRRKQIGSLLGRSHTYPPGILPTHRPENLSIEQLAQLIPLLVA